MGGSSSPTSIAVKKIVDLFSAQESVKFYSYQDALDFSELWSLIEDISSSERDFSTPCAFIVVWDGFPERPDKSSPVDVTRYITPIDWAVAFSLSVRGKNREGSWPDLKIFIVDVEGLAGSDSGTLKFFENFERRTVKNMPWIRIFGPGQEDQVWGFENLLLNIACAAHPPGSTFPRRSELVGSMKQATEYEKQGLDVIKTYLVANLTRPSNPGDHHAIANIIGPLLFMEIEGIDQQIYALQVLMRQLDLIPKRDQTDDFLSSERPWFDFNNERWKQALDRLMHSDKGTLELILIDDMFQLGWGKMLCWVFGVKYRSPSTPCNSLTEIGRSTDNRVIVKACTSPEIILRKLEEFNEDSLDHRFRFKVDQDIRDSLEILFLDLRLFSGSPLEEVSFLRRIACVAEKLNKRINLPWKKFDQKKVKNCLEGNFKCEDASYIEALTFLPRVLALIDLSLPIVIFSSTGRRDITEEFKDYRNIITAFDKPKFTVAIPENVASITRTKFYEAARQAFSVIGGRVTCKQVLLLGQKAEEFYKLNHKPVETSDFRHVEIYLDERGGPKDLTFSVGGLIVAYPNYSSVFELSNCLKDAGIYWCSNQPLEQQPDTRHLSKEPNKQNEAYQGACAVTGWQYEDAAKRLFSICDEKKIFLAAVRVDDSRPKLRSSQKKEEHYVLKDVQGDGRYVRTLKVLLELVLFELLPTWSPEKLTVSIFPATRIAKLNFAGSSLNAEKPEDYFGFGIGPQGKYYTISSNSISPIVSNVLTSRRDVPPHIEVHHARGVTLTYGIPNRLPWDKIRTQHYFADHVLRPEAQQIYAERFQFGFQTLNDNDLQSLLAAWREITDQNVGTAINRASECKDINEKMHSHLMMKIANSLNALDGNVFISICEWFH